MKWIWLLTLTVTASAQQPLHVAPLHVAPPQFDAASVKPVQLRQLAPSRIVVDPGRFKAQSSSVTDLIAFAYAVQPAQIVNLKSGPDRYDVEGKTDQASSRADLRVMLQTLLADRFRLKFHRETREIAADRLVVGKDLKLRASDSSEADPRGFRLSAGDRGPDFLKAKATAMSLEWLANDLSGHLSRLVVDGTGLKELYAFEVEFEFDRAEASDPNVPEREASNRIREGLLSALGLKIQSGSKEPVEVLVIDRIERPEVN